MVSDVSCDPNNPDNPIRIYNQSTKLSKPIIESDVSGLYVQAVDHLPTVLPKESSEDFAGQFRCIFLLCAKVKIQTASGQGHVISTQRHRTL